MLKKPLRSPLTQNLGSISVKPVIVLGLITNAQSAAASVGWDNGASVQHLDNVGTSEVPNCHVCVSASPRYEPTGCPAAAARHAGIRGGTRSVKCADK